MTEPRPHRQALAPEQAAEALGREAGAGRLDADAAAAVLEAAGQRVPRVERPAGLTEREVEVVGLLARGLQTKQVARRLGISVKTADRHIQNAYAKIGVSTRAAAALFAMQHGLIGMGRTPDRPHRPTARSVPGSRSASSGRRAMPEREPEQVETVIIGGGQAGLSVGYHLARRGRPFLILDANQRIGDAWRNRWDSMRLFTPARYSGLTGMPFPGPAWSFPTKDEMADYLEDYADRFGLPVQTGVRVDRLSRRDGRLEVAAGDRRWEAGNVVVAMANYQRPRVPAFAPELDPGIVQLHAAGYRNPAQLRDGDVLVVGAGNRGRRSRSSSRPRTGPGWRDGTSARSRSGSRAPRPGCCSSG